MKKSVMGPLVSEIQYNKVLDYIKIAKEEGAELIFGGNKPNDSELTPKNGYFIEPTIFRVKKNMKVWKEEIFGPVLSILTF